MCGGSGGVVVVGVVVVVGTAAAATVAWHNKNGSVTAKNSSQVPCQFNKHFLPV